MSDFRQSYAGRADEELLKILLEADNLLPEARVALEQELARRKLSPDDAVDLWRHIRTLQAKEQERRLTLMQRVAKGIRRQLIFGVATAFAVVLLGSIMIEFAEYIPQFKRVFIGMFLLGVIAILYAMRRIKQY